MLDVQIVNNSKHPLPEYKTALSAGMDLHANLDEPVTLKPLERRLIPTGLHIQLPAGYEAQVRTRSGMALKQGLMCLNSPGTVDADYTGDVGVILANMSNEEVTIEDGERIAQLVVAKHETVQWDPVLFLVETTRGEGGFGSTGK